jgi:hypothetical protein
MRDTTIYTAINIGASTSGKNTYSFDNDEEPCFNCFMVCFQLFVACLAISMCLVVPILGIIFSQVYPWQEDGSVCDPKNPVKCTCHEHFPMYMLVGGVLYIISASSWVGFEFADGRQYFSEEISTTRTYVATCVCVVIIPSIVVMALMADSFLSSDRKCGESLWQYGGIMFAFFIIFLCFPCLKLFWGRR